MHGSTWVGCDVHLQTVAIGVIRPGQEPEHLGQFVNRPEVILKQLLRLAEPAQLRVCYEAGPTGYGLYRYLTRHGITCLVAAPSLIPTKAGDRIKTDRRDALKLARLLRSGDLTAVAVPTAEQEALRDLSRAREAAAKDLHRVRQRFLKFLHRQELREPTGGRWTKRWWAWAEGITVAQPVAQVVLEELRQAIRDAQGRVDHLTVALESVLLDGPVAPQAAALQQMHGIGPITAVGIIAELGDLTRFPSATQVTAYAGLVPRESSSGNRRRQGGITKTGNSHLRYLLVEAAWHYSTRTLPARKPVACTPVDAIAITTRYRLHRRFYKLTATGKPRQVAAVAIARQLLEAVWAMGQVIATNPNALTPPAPPARLAA